MKTKILSLEDFTWENYAGIAAALTEFDESNVEDQISIQATLYSYYYGLMSEAKRIAANVSTDLDMYVAGKRKEVKRETTIKLTAKDLDDAVFSTSDYGYLSNELNAAQFKYELLKGLVRSLEHKKDMIVQISANKREETKLYNR